MFHPRRTDPSRSDDRTSRLRSSSRVAAVAAAALGLAACGGEPTAPRGTGNGGDEVVASVEVTPAADTLEAVGATVQLAAVARDADGEPVSGVSISWSSSNESVVTVDDQGLVEAVAEGDAVISATASGASGTATLAVSQSVDAVSVSPPSATLTAVGDTVRFTATAVDGNGTEVPGIDVTWSSEDTTVATVDDEGLALAVGEGAAAITATARDVAGQAEVTVNQSIDHLSFRTQPTSVGAGDTIAPAVRVGVVDRFGNPVSDAGLSITVTLEGSTFVLAGGLTGTTTVDAVDGVAVFDDLWVKRAHEGYTLEATAGGTVPAATSRSFDVTAGDLGVIRFTGQPGDATAGEAIDPAVVVSLEDVFGNVVTDATGPVALEIADGPAGAELAGTASASPASGVATFGNLVLETAGGYTLRASAGGVTSDPSVAFGVLPGPAAQLGFFTQPADIEGQEPIDPAVEVEALDEFGNRATRFSGPVTVRLASDPTGGRAVITSSGRRVTTVDASHGLATFDLALDLPGDGYTLRATSPFLTSATSDPFSVSLTFTTVDAGWSHTCAVTVRNAAYCWGDNDDAALGDASAADALFPVAVAGFPSWDAISAGADHSCGLRVSGANANCWGNNFFGQIGDGTTSDRSSPRSVTLPLTFQTISAGAGYTCGVAADRVRCWGRNEEGQLGDGTLVERHDPVTAAHSADFTAVSAAELHTCALSTHNEANVFCWGSGRFGKLGHGGTADETSPRRVAEDLPFVAVAAGRYHTCAVADDGRMLCWGRNHHGQLGDGTTTDRSSPVDVSGGLDFATVSAGADHTCGLTASGDAYCWGGNFDGQLGDGTTSVRTSPVTVSGGLTFTAISAGADYTCGLTTGGDVYCWGVNFAGQLGDGTTASRTTPTRVVQ